MDERQVCEVVLARAVEREDSARAIVPEAELQRAGEEAARQVGAAAGVEAYLAFRATLVLDRALVVQPALRHVLQVATPRGFLAVIVPTVALAAGLATQLIGPSASIDILAPPVLSLLLWNALVYLVLLGRRATRARPGPRSVARPGFLRARLLRFAARPPAAAAVHGAPVLARVVGRFLAEWRPMAAPLDTARITGLLHLGAALFAAGVMAGLYLRGVAVLFRASWQSTFLDAETVHRLLAFVLAPGAWLTGIPVPSVQAIAALATTVPGGGENAAPWLHLHAATVLVFVVVPRLLLAAVAAIDLARRKRRLALPLDDPYFRRLARDYAGERAAIRVVPYSYRVPDAARHVLEEALRRAFGDRADVAWSPPVGYGEEDALMFAGGDVAGGIVIALFNATATPEDETHAHFVARVRTAFGPGWQVLAVVDESAWRERFPDDAVRLARRCTAWRSVLAAGRAPVACCALTADELPAAEAAVAAAAEAVSG